jgi:hypothetical protein
MFHAFQGTLLRVFIGQYLDLISFLVRFCKTPDERLTDRVTTYQEEQ